jgi:serine/threonine protein kinase
LLWLFCLRRRCGAVQPLFFARFQDLVIGRELGRGAVGVVQEAFWKSGGLAVAVKKLTSDVDQLTLNEFRREIAVHSAIAHQNVVRIYGMIELKFEIDCC